MSDLVFITGATGHIGFHVLTKTLEAGYAVRAAVRSEAKAKALLSAPELKDEPTEKLSTVIVPDLLAPGAYDEALQGGVKYVIHVASPLSSDSITSDQFESHLVQPAVRGTLGILESAKKAGTVRRIVITSSVVALRRGSDFIKEVPDVLSAESRIPTPSVEGLSSTFEAYAASKATAFNESEAWIKREKPEFDVVNICPSFVMGREGLNATAQSLTSHGTNRLILGQALGAQLPGPIGNASVHVDDVAQAHVAALDVKVPGNSKFILNSDATPDSHDTDFSSVTKYVARLFPDAVAKGVLPNNGGLESFSVRIDAKKTEETFGFKHKNFEQQVKDVIEQYLEIVQKA